MHDKFAQLNHFQASPRDGWTQSWAGRALLQVWSFAAAEEAGGEPCPFPSQASTSSHGRIGILTQGPTATGTPPLQSELVEHPGMAVHVSMDEWQNAGRCTQTHTERMGWESSSWQEGVVLFCSIFCVLKDLQQVVKSLHSPCRLSPTPFVWVLPVLVPPPAYAPCRYGSLLSHAFLRWAELKEKISM